MINRTLIRIKVIQMVYSYLLTKEETPLRDAVKDLAKSFDKSYELYNYLLLLMIELTDLQERRIDDARNKYLPSYEELNPNTRFIENEFIKKLREDETLGEYVKANKLTWKEDDIFMKMLLEKITHSKVYEKYMAQESTDFAKDCEVWKDLMKHVILSDEGLADILESKSVFWNDDLMIMGTFAIKTIKRVQDGVAEPLLPMYKDQEDSEFGKTLFMESVSCKDENDELIDKYITENWEADRVAFMDRVILGVCVTEIKKFPSIPTSVSLNEYIELAKYYSTPKSGSFVNGILNSIVKEFKAKRVIVKD